MNRFGIRHFPSIYHLIGQETREYTGRRSLPDLVAYAKGNFKKTKARSGCSSPTSRCGRMLGKVTNWPARLKSKYFELRDKNQYSDVSLFAGILAVPVVFGLAVVAALDLYYSRRPLDTEHLHHH